MGYVNCCIYAYAGSKLLGIPPTDTTIPSLDDLLLEHDNKNIFAIKIIIKITFFIMLFSLYYIYLNDYILPKINLYFYFDIWGFAPDPTSFVATKKQKGYVLS